MTFITLNQTNLVILILIVATTILIWLCDISH